MCLDIFAWSNCVAVVLQTVATERAIVEASFIIETYALFSCIVSISSSSISEMTKLGR